MVAAGGRVTGRRAYFSLQPIFSSNFLATILKFGTNIHHHKAQI
jgi:hypothetical protein